MIGAPIIDSDASSLAVFRVGELQARPEWERLMCSGHGVLVKDITTRCPPAVEARSIPARVHGLGYRRYRRQQQNHESGERTLVQCSTPKSVEDSSPQSPAKRVRIFFICGLRRESVQAQSRELFLYSIKNSSFGEPVSIKHTCYFHANMLPSPETAKHASSYGRSKWDYLSVRPW